MDCCLHTQDIDAYFDERKARSEVAHYLKKGLVSHARAMFDAVNARGLKDASVLEVGGGIGGLQIELLKRGAAHATNVEVSAAYLTAAQTLAGQLGLADRVRYHRGDFACESDAVPAADLIILHRVICCYPDMPRLVSAAAQHSRRLTAPARPARQRSLLRPQRSALHRRRRANRQLHRLPVAGGSDRRRRRVDRLCRLTVHCLKPRRGGSARGSRVHRNGCGLGRGERPVADHFLGSVHAGWQVGDRHIGRCGRAFRPRSVLRKQKRGLNGKRGAHRARSHRRSVCLG